MPCPFLLIDGKPWDEWVKEYKKTHKIEFMAVIPHYYLSLIHI